MQLPSIVKQQPTMKGKPHGNNTITNTQQPPNQDTFGLGIQVFKIDAKSINNNSSGKARQNMKNFENPTAKKEMTPSSHIPKAKKASGLLPNIHRDQQKDVLPLKTRAQSVFSKRKVEQRIVSTHKIDSIKEIVPKKPAPVLNPKIAAQEQNKPLKTVTKGVSKANKTAEKIVQNVENDEDVEKVTRMEWRFSLSGLSHFYKEEEQFEKQELTKVGRKKNQDYLQESKSFVQAYVEKESYFYEAPNEYEHFGIENYGERGFEHYSERGFEHLNYQNFVME